jgi:hypothetical protein
MADYLTFANIYDAVCSAIGDQGTSGSQSRLAEVKAVINMVYINEICNCDELFPLFWLMDIIDDVKTKTRATITGITKANPGVITATAHGFVSGDIVQLDSIAGMTELNHRTFVVVYATADTFSLKDLEGTAINTTNYTTYSSGGYAMHRGVTLSKSFEMIRNFSWHGYKGNLDPVSLDEMADDYSLTDPENTGRPTRHHHKQAFDASGNKYDRLMWFTLPDAVYEARIWGRLCPSVLTSSTDIPKLPFQFHHAIIAGSIARMVKYDNVQIENSIIWPGLYKQHIDSICTYNRNWWKQFKRDERSGIYLL